MRLNYEPVLKTLSAILASILVVAILSFLIVESRTVKDEYYVSHADQTRAIEAIEADIGIAVDGLENAFEVGAVVQQPVNLAFARLSENNERLQSLQAVRQLDSEMQTLFVNFSDELHQFIASGLWFSEKQNSMADALRALQQESPSLVRALREERLTDQAQFVFMLAIDLIEFATDEQRSDAKPIYARIQDLRADNSLQSESTRTFLDAAKAIVDEHTAAQMTLGDVRSSNVTTALSALRSATLDSNRETVRRAELARLLLSVCAVVLLLGAAYALIRLQASYRELNKSNFELEQANTRLEERVAARTELLSKANDELRESQSQLIHAEKMSSLGQMVAGISHEINTPLWYLMNNSSVIQERLDLASELCKIAKSMTTAAQSGTSVKESLHRGLTDMHGLLKDGIEDDIDEARSLIQDNIYGLDELTSLAQGLKDFSRLDRSIQGAFNVNDGLDKALLIASNRIKNRINVHKYYQDVPSVYCTPSQINQVFLNLLTNAADAIKSRGDLVIQTWEEDGSVGISISDSGAGIPADVLPKIRDPFFTTKEVGTGTGLGLSIVDQIITKHRGDFHIESEAGKGTCVTVILPISAQKPQEIDPDLNGEESPIAEATAMAARQNIEQLPEDVPRLLSA